MREFVGMMGDHGKRKGKWFALQNIKDKKEADPVHVLGQHGGE